MEAHWDGSLANTGFLERIPGLPVVSFTGQSTWNHIAKGLERQSEDSVFYPVDGDWGRVFTANYHGQRQALGKLTFQPRE